MKKNVFYASIYFVLISFSFLTLGACSTNDAVVEDNEAVERLERTITDLESTIIQRDATIALLEDAASDSAEHRDEDADVLSEVFTFYLPECEEDCIELALPELWAGISGSDRFAQANVTFDDGHIMSQHIRVFENGNANVRLFPDGTFIANLFHNTKVTGTYSEVTQGNETAVLFSYGGISYLSDGVSSFEATGATTVVGGLVDNVLTIPEDWDDGHGHGMDFPFRAYPIVFVGENNQNILLHADNTFVANFDGAASITGFYGLRANSITFVPGSPTFNSSGVPVGSFLFARLGLRSELDSEPDHEQEHNHSHDHSHDHNHSHSHDH